MEQGQVPGSQSPRCSAAEDYVPKCGSWPLPVREEGTEVFEQGLE